MADFTITAVTVTDDNRARVAYLDDLGEPGFVFVEFTPDGDPDRRELDEHFENLIGTRVARQARAALATVVKRANWVRDNATYPVNEQRGLDRANRIALRPRRV